MNPYVLAFLASLCFGVVVFPWQNTLRDLGLPGFLLLTGVAYMIAGCYFYLVSGIPGLATPRTLGTGILTAAIYLTALLLCSTVFANPKVNVSIATAITAGYPAWTALIALLAHKERLSTVGVVFLVMTVVGVVGLALSPKS